MAVPVNQELAAQIEALIKQYEEAANNGDGVKLAHLYTEDGTLCIAGREPFHGRSALEKFYHKEPNAQGKKGPWLTIKSEGAVCDAGNRDHPQLLVSYGTVVRHIPHSDGNEVYEHKQQYQIVYVKVQGEWKIKMCMAAGPKPVPEHVLTKQ